MDFTEILVEVAAPVATVTLNRPQALNAMTSTSLAELEQAVLQLQDDAAVSVVILTGAGERAFAAGGDISAMAEYGPMEARRMALNAQRIFKIVEACPKPVIAAVNGFALGGGCELAMACDIRIAADTARFGQPEVNLGIIPGFAGSQRLPRLVGKGRAKELLFTGEMIDAAEAWRIGLVNKVVPAAELLDAARSMAQIIASKGQVAVALTKEAVDMGMEMDLDRASAYEADLFALCFATSDQKEGMRAFLEKRKARFRGE